MKAVAVYLKQKLKEQLKVSSGNHDMHVLAVGVLEITIILERDSDNQIFLNGDVLLNGRRVDLDGTLKWSCGRTVVVQGEKHQRSLAIGREDTGHVSKLCVKTLFISKNFHS